MQCCDDDEMTNDDDGGEEEKGVLFMERPFRFSVECNIFLSALYHVIPTDFLTCAASSSNLMPAKVRWIYLAGRGERDHVCREIIHIHSGSSNFITSPP